MAKRKLNFKRHQPVRLPNGRTVKISFIEHPGAVIVAPILPDGRVVFMRQYRPALRKYIYELPAGTLDPKEAPMVCARRELLEETGYTGKKFKRLGKIYPVPGYSTEIIHIFKAEGLTPGLAQPEEYEVIQNKPMTRSQVRQLLDRGVLQDAKSICALVFCGWL